jgi:hypothetical protein
MTVQAITNQPTKGNKPQKIFASTPAIYANFEIFSPAKNCAKLHSPPQKSTQDPGQ